MFGRLVAIMEGGTLAIGPVRLPGAEGEVERAVGLLLQKLTEVREIIDFVPGVDVVFVRGKPVLVEFSAIRGLLKTYP